MTPRLLLNSTKPKDYARGECVEVCVAVGSTGQSADQGGRPAYWWRPLPPTARGWAFLGLALSEHWDTACLEWIWVGSWATLSPMSLNQCSDNFCDFMSGQSVLATYILAQKHNLHFLEGEV